MSIRYSFVFATIGFLFGCGGLDGFEAKNADLKLRGAVTNPLPNDTPSFVSGPVTISTKNAYFAINFPAIFEMQVLDPDEPVVLVNWDHEFRNGETCIDRVRQGAYVIDCGSREGDLLVYMTVQEDFGQRTILYQTYIEPYTTVTEADIFSNGR